MIWSAEAKLEFLPPDRVFNNFLGFLLKIWGFYDLTA